MRVPTRPTAPLVLLLGLLVPLSASAQSADPYPANPYPTTSASERLAAVEQRAALAERSLLRQVPIRSAGPTIMSGRVVDLDVSPSDPSHFYVAYASGGLWKTTAGGTAFEPLFDDQAVMTIGDIAVRWSDDEETIYVGTGENNSSRSSYAGTGVYRSDDGGATWEHLGLEETHRTGRIVLHPTDPNTLWVAAAGALYAPGPERGVYKTTDGGRTWTKTLYVDTVTGAIDLVMDPADPNVLYAAMWHRERRAWDFVESGDGSGIWKSTDGGDTWDLLSTAESGFPTGATVGRIGLALSPAAPGVIYALLDNQERRPPEEDEAPALTTDMLRSMDREAFLAVSAEALDDFLERNGFPAAYTAASIMDMIRAGELEPVALVEYLEDANRLLFETPVIGAEVYRSEDGGATWARTHDDFIDNVYYSYGYYFGEIRVAPDDPDRVYIMGVPILKSEDGGRTFRSINEPNVHVDHHALWVSPDRPGHLVNGNDGGVNVSFDDGASWFKLNAPPVGQFYAVQVDAAEPYTIYGGLQDNGVWGGPSTYEASSDWQGEGAYPYERILGGDGMQIEVDTRTNDLVYTGFQFGNYFRIDRAAGTRTYIQPKHELGERPLRFNWQTPIHLSRHNQDVLYLGSHKLHRSLNRGDDWETLSDDLTQGGRRGDVPYGTLTSIDESPLRFGLLYVGSDDGLVHVSRDGGYSWDRISDDLPPDLWVSRVEASHHAPGRVYVSLNGYRWDHFDGYLYRSDDYGQTWTRLGSDLPAEPINVVLEDEANGDLLYVGTDHGLYASLDGGRSFTTIGDLPAAPVHDLKLQPAARELVVGTHGRSIYVADVEHVQALTDTLLADPVYVFALGSVRHREGWGERAAAWMDVSEPSVLIPIYTAAASPLSVDVLDADGHVLQTLEAAPMRGLHYVEYDLSVAPDAAARWSEPRGDTEEAEPLSAAANGTFYLPPGTYVIRATTGDAEATTPLVIEAPPPPERPAVPGSAERRAMGKG